MKQITGGVTAAKGFQAASTAAGIKYKDRKDMAMIYSEVPCKAAGTFTTNIVKAAPVKWVTMSYTTAKQHRRLSSMQELPMPAPERKAWATAGRQLRK